MAPRGSASMFETMSSRDMMETDQTLLRFLRTLSPIALLLAFVVAFVVSSVISAMQVTPPPRPACGPGGRPLPKRTRSSMATIKKNQNSISPRFRVVFQWLSITVLLTFVVDAALNITHAILDRSEHWWRGQAAVVGFPFRRSRTSSRGRKKKSLEAANSVPDLHCWLFFCACHSFGLTH